MFNELYIIYIIYLFVKDLDLCLDVYCVLFGICKIYSVYEVCCVCNENCFLYQDLVCIVNGIMYDNKCLYELSYCKGLDNSIMYYFGSCEGRFFNIEGYLVCNEMFYCF